MTDLLQNVQHVYKKWESRANPHRGRHRGNSQQSRFEYRKYNYENDSSSYSRSRDLRSYKKTQRYTVPKYEGLAEFKMAPCVVPLRQARPFVGIPCAKCVPHSRAGIEDATVYLLGVHNILHIPYFPMQSFNISCFWNLFRLYPSLPHGTEFDILKCIRVEDAIEEIVNSCDQDSTSESFDVEKLYTKGRTILKDLKSSISSLCIDITGFCLHHILKKLFSGIFVHKGQIEILKILSQESIPFVYLPLHRSYFDYILIPYILYMNSLRTPFTTVADELHIPIMSFFFRIMGAIFIRNNLFSGNSDDDILYRAIVQSYIVKCLENGRDVQYHIEEGRSISGKPQIAKTKLLSAVVHSVADGSIEDAYVVPVNISYEITEDTFVAERLGGHSKVESSFVSKLHSMWRLMHLKYGNVRVNFNQPFSIKEFLKSYSTKQSKLKESCISNSPLSSPSSEKSSSSSDNQMNIQVSALATHIIYDATNCTSLMSTHLLAFLLLIQYRKGGTQQQLQNSMDWLRGEILHKKCNVGFSGESLPAVKRAVELFGKDLILTETIEMEWTTSDLENNNVKVKVYTPIVKLPHVLELQYYANAVVPLFLKESLVVNALYALVDVDICHFHHCDSRFYVSRDGLIQMARKLNEFFKYEFVTLPPCEDIVSSFNDVIDALVEKECLTGTGTDLYFRSSSKHKSHALSFANSSDEEQCEDEIGQQLKIDLREESISHLEFLRNILSPYIESYWLGACSLLRLIDEVKEESVFIQEMQITAQDKLYKGLLAYEESFSADTLKNCLKMFWDKQIIEYAVIDNIKTVCLSESYNCFESVNDVIADIEDFRK